MKHLLTLLLLLTAWRSRAGEVDVSAAASLRDALEVIAAQYEQRTGDHVVLNCGASSMLASQIVAGAPADLLLSADAATMDRVATVAGTRRNLLSNTLVVLSNRPLKRPRDLLSLSRIALADPQAVPAGVYARAWLQRAGLWDAIASRVIPTANVRAALAAADSGNVDAAIVYRTDALLAKRAHVAFAITGPDAPLIRYPLAIVRQATHPEAARRFHAYLLGGEAGAVFRRFGFVTIDSQ